MKICMMLEAEYPPDIRVQKEVRALTDVGHDVYILSYEMENRPRRERVDGGIVVRRPLRQSLAGARGWLPGLRYLLTYVHNGWIREAREVIKTEDIDALHAHDLPIVKTAIGLGDEYDIPVIADLHENWPEAKRYYRKGTLWKNAKSNPRLILARLLKSTWRLKQFEKFSVQNADQVIAIVEEGKEHYVNDCGANSERVSVISNVVDLETFDSFETSRVGFEDEFVITYIGTLSGEHRGLDTIIKGMPKITEGVEDARLLIVGPTSNYAETLNVLSVDLDIDHHVTFTGRVPFEEVPSFLAASNVCIVPHKKNPHTETTVPHKLFQYMAKRKPVVVTDVRPLERIVHETDSGLVVPSDNPIAMAEAIVELAHDSDMRHTMGQNGRNAVERRYNWKVEGDKLRRLYQSLEST